MIPAEPPRALSAGIPQRGVFATSEVLPMMRDASRLLTEKRDEWRKLRDAAAEAKALAKKTRADLLIYLRVWGNEQTGHIEIKTAVERNEWADADAEVQKTELAADLAQSAAMDARAALDQAEAEFSALSGMLAIERDENKREYAGPPR